MSSSVPLPLLAAVPLADVAYLLLGDLRLLLEEPADVSTSRWLVSILDCLLANRVRLESVLAWKLTVDCLWNRGDDLDHEFYGKLQRLRDRVAHRKPYALLANEVRCDLAELLAPL